MPDDATDTTNVTPISAMAAALREEHLKTYFDYKPQIAWTFVEIDIVRRRQLTTRWCRSSVSWGFPGASCARSHGTGVAWQYR